MMMRGEQRQQQSLTLTPMQRQLVEMIELPDVAMEGYLDEVVSSNPALSRVVDTGRGTEVGKAFARRATDEDLPPIEDRMSASADLLEHLADQFRLELTTDEEREAGMYILGNLDGRGFLGVPLEDVAFEAGVTLADAESAQLVVMGLDPSGCGASNLRQYLTYMVQEQWPEDPFFPEIIRDHLEELTRGRYAPIAKALDMDAEDVEEYHRMLREEVGSTPARGYADCEADYVRPSMDVVRDPESGEWRVEMHDASRSQVKLDPSYEARVRALPRGAARDEAIEKLEQARWVMRCLEERHSLVKQVAEIAVKRQHLYFELGADHLHNLTMAEVGEVLQRDTSTISRAVTGRYFRWAGGTVALRELFANRGSGQDTSEAGLHAAIRQIVAGEDKRCPLSDDAIADQLIKSGLSGVARRTVAKHRERIGIPSSRDRKQAR